MRPGARGGAKRLRRSALPALALAAGCAGPLFDLAELAHRHPELGPSGASALAELLPYGYPGPGGLWLFSCRWPEGEAVPVSLPVPRSEDEDRVLRLALTRWEEAIPGLALRPVEEPAGSGIELRFDPEPASPRAGEAAAECQVDPASLEAGAARAAARLVSARVALRRDELDGLGRPTPHSPAELLGSALHELGHALGFQGHPRRDSAVLREVEEVRHLGERVLAGAPLRDASLAALYRLPSGTLLGRIALRPETLAPIHQLAAAAGRAGFLGPRLQVGDREARIVWRDGAGRGAALRLPDWPELLAGRAPPRVEVLPRARELIARESAPAP